MLDLRDQIRTYFIETAPPVDIGPNEVGHSRTHAEPRHRPARRPALVLSVAFVAVILLLVLPLLLSRDADAPPATQLTAPPPSVDTTVDGQPSEGPTVDVASSLPPLDLSASPEIEPPTWASVDPPPGWKTAPWTIDTSTGESAVFLTYPDFELADPVVTTEDGISWTSSVERPAPNAIVTSRQSDGTWLGTAWLGGIRGRDRYFSRDGELWEPIAFKGEGAVAVADEQLIVVISGEAPLKTVLSGPIDDPHPSMEMTVRGPVHLEGPVLIDAGAAVATRDPSGSTAPTLFLRTPEGDWSPIALPVGTKTLHLDAGRIYAVVERSEGSEWSLFWSTGRDDWTELVALRSAQLGSFDAVESGVAMTVVSTAPDAEGSFFVWVGNDRRATWQRLEPRTRVVAVDSFMLRISFDRDSFELASTPVNP